MKKRITAAASVMLVLLLTAGMQCVPAQTDGMKEILSAPAETGGENAAAAEETEGEDGTAEAELPEGSYEIEPGYEENTDIGVIRWYGAEQAEEGILVTAAEGYKVCAEQSEEDSSFQDSCRVKIGEEETVFYVMLPGGEVVKEVRTDLRTDTAAPEINVIMNGRQDEDGMFYYRAENCGITLRITDEGPVVSGENLTSEVFLDGTGLEVRKRMQNGVLELNAAPETVAALGDGKHRLSVRVSDTAGNLSETVTEEGNEGVVLTEGAAEFILDTAAPVCRLTVVPGNAAVKELCSPGERYYFNSGYTAEAVIRDDHPDAGKIRMMRGEETGETYESEKVQISDFLYRVPEEDTHSDNEGTGDEPGKSEKTVRFTDAVTGDGVYRYEIYGTDKAGNPLVTERSSAMETEGNRSRHIVVDTKAPRGLLTVSSGGICVYEMNTDGAVLRAEPFLSSREAEIRLSVDDRTERSPVRLAFTVDANPRSGSGDADTGGWTRNAVLKRQQSGRQEFSVTSYSLTDLAGNRTVGSVPHRIRLDADSPEVDALSPVIGFTASGGDARAGTVSGRTGNGTPLFSSDVTLSVSVSDPCPQAGSSGIGRISYELFKGGSAAAEGVLWEDSDNSGDGDGSLIYKVTRQLLVPAEDYEENDLKVFIYAQDHAGNTASRSYGFGIDAAPPEIVVSVSGGTARNGMYYSEPRKAVITVKEKNFVPEKIRAGGRRTGSGDPSGQDTDNPEGFGAFAWTKIPQDGAAGGEQSADLYRTELLFEKDGEYELTVFGEDAAGNRSVSVKYEGEAAEHFVVDRTPPEVKVSYDRNDARNGIYYRNRRTAEITVRDGYFGGEHRLFVREGKDGEKRDPEIVFEEGRAGVVFSEDGIYALGGTVTDLAGNESAPLEEELFVIDQTPPVLTAEGVREWSANREPVSVLIKVEDENPDPGSLKAELRALNRGKTELFKYEAGTRTAAEGGSGQNDPILLPLPAITEDDLYRLTAGTADLAGNEASAELTFSENRNGTVFVFEQQEVQGKYIRESIRPSFLLYNIDEISVLSVTVNGAEVPYSFRENRLILKNSLAEDGKYVIGIDVRDAAGNINSMDPVEFFIDTAPPVIRIGGLHPGETEYSEDVEITLRTEREEDFFRYVKLDGKTLFRAGENGTEKAASGSVFSGTMCGIRENGDLFLKITEYGDHTLVMQAEDPAGNRSAEESYSFVLRADVKERWLGDRPVNRFLYIVTFMIPGAAAVPVWRRIRRKRFL